MSILAELNGFIRNSDGVYAANQNRNFGYSDGAGSEVALHKILSQAKNLSSDSEELESHIVDWPSEYHLSSARANLLRCLDLNGVKRVLELGCGCGSISRYLGEQTHIQVDAIEGSPSRAALAALRCRDLDNVTIHSANFNEVEFPDSYYDLVLFVGVTEYAGRFSKKPSDQEALQDLLSLAKQTAKQDGVVLVAIENRVGLKYLHGASEDHYGKPYIGVENYPESEGIRTYTKDEWKEQIAKSNFTHYEFLYPFPDYKIPSCIVHDRALHMKEVTAQLLEVFKHIKSRDYTQAFDLGEKEALLWRGMHEAGALAEVANSFLILLSDEKSQLDSIAKLAIKSFSCSDFAVQYSSPVQSTVHRADIGDSDLKSDSVKQIQELQNQLDLLQRSRGWRCLQWLRGLSIPGLRPRQ